MPRYSEDEARQAIRDSFSYAEALRKPGLFPSGGNHRQFRRHADEVWQIATEHFDPTRTQRLGVPRTMVPLEDVLVEGSTYSRSSLKRTLFAVGLKAPRCELCGQGETWRGHRMAMILDHINGVPNDNRINNLRIVCPNCAATFDTHCGRKNGIDRGPRVCLYCGRNFVAKYEQQKYCSRGCGVHAGGSHAEQPARRKVPRPSHEQLVEDLESMSFVAVGRKYGVSDKAVRKWLRWYELSPEADGRADAA